MRNELLAIRFDRMTHFYSNLDREHDRAPTTDQLEAMGISQEPVLVTMNHATFFFERTMSAVPGRSRRWSLNLKPALCSALRTVNSVRELTEGTLATISLRFVLDT